MPTRKPRIAVTVEYETHAILSKYSELTNESMASVVADLLNASMPQITNMITLLEKAKSAPDEMKKQLIERLEINQEKLEKALFEASQTDFITEEKQR